VATDREKGEGSEDRIAELARELAEAINESGGKDRVGARDYAIDFLREEVDTEVIASAEETSLQGAPAAMNPFGLGIPLLFLGVVLVPLFGLMGLAIASIGIFMCVVGVAMAVVGQFRKKAEVPPE
jgi:hypothetical protein